MLKQMRTWMLWLLLFSNPGWLLLGQVLSAREMAGCAVMLAACVLAQLPEKRRAAVGR